MSGRPDDSRLSNASSNILENPVPLRGPQIDSAVFPSSSTMPHDDEDDSEEFKYQESNLELDQASNDQFLSEDIESQLDHREYPETSVGVKQTNGVALPSSAQLEAVFTATSSGDLHSLQMLFQRAQEQDGTGTFSLANNATSRTGLTPLHVAASRGHISIVRWLIEQCGALADLEDKEGETALHKASLNGNFDVIVYLLSYSLPMGKADVHARDADGWTPLHNACSKGYLDIVRWLCENGSAADPQPSSHGTSEQVARGIDQKSAGGWTPLMNAASKGHLPVVHYLLTKQSANPLVRNNWGETAYDVAAAVFEVWICEVLQRAEMDYWRNSPTSYNLLAVHTTVPLILYENQRLDNRFKTLAVSSGRPKFSASGLGRRDRRGPFELRLPPGSEDQGKQDVVAWRSNVQLPLIQNTFELPLPNRDVNPREVGERSHFWLSDWTLDASHPRVDVHEGWQYARSMDDPDDQWTAEMPPALERVMSSSSSSSQVAWVRRRRWVRLMRRRLDIPPLPFLEPDGSMYLVTGDGALIPFTQDDAFDPDGGEELGSMPQSYLSFTQDYVSRARYLAGAQHGNELESMLNSATAADVRKSIAKLERAVLELRAGDEDTERKTHAEVLLNAYSHELERRRLEAGANGLYRIEDEDVQVDDDDDSDGSFHYPTTPTSSARPSSIHSHHTDSSRRRISRTSTDLSPQLSQTAEFWVPTHETPQKFSQATLTPHSIHAQWEKDETVTSCRSCNRKFTFLFRKHHCRKCGRIFCDRCSSYRSVLDPTEVVQDPANAEASSSNSMHRVCLSCYDMSNSNVPSRFHGLGTTSMERIVVDQGRLAAPNTPRGDASSQISDLADCPVCGQNLMELGNAETQEGHVKACLEGPSFGSSTQQAGKYLVYRLPAESALIGIECVICLEEFLQGSLVARLSCLCTFHNVCLSAWLQRRGRNCPVHARDT